MVRSLHAIPKESSSLKISSRLRVTIPACTINKPYNLGQISQLSWVSVFSAIKWCYWISKVPLALKKHSDFVTTDVHIARVGTGIKDCVQPGLWGCGKSTHRSVLAFFPSRAVRASREVVSSNQDRQRTGGYLGERAKKIPLAKDRQCRTIHFPTESAVVE